MRVTEPDPIKVKSENLPRVSILIVNFNGASYLRACLDSLRALTWPNRELVVVDNASSDQSLEVLADYPEAAVVRSSVNLGFAGGNNLGLKHCSGEYILLLNNDTVTPPGLLEPLCRTFMDKPQVGAVQGKMILPRFGNRLDVCGSFLTAIGLPYHYGYYKRDGPSYQKSYPVFSGKGACLLFRREIIARVGGFLFDEDFFCYYEEADFCHRVWLAGFEVWFVSGPATQHFMGATSGDSQSEFVLRHYLRNMAFSLLSNLSLLSRMRILPLFFGVAGLSLAVSLLRGRTAVFRAHLEMFKHCVRSYGKIIQRRKLIKQIRRVPDRVIFDAVMRTPGLGYFLRTFTGELGKYQDRPTNSARKLPN
jgi:GT2 family glycosyltransferase